MMGNHREDAPKKAIPVAETTEKGKLEQVKRDVDTETRKLAIEKGDPIAKMKLNLAWAKQYPDHELATSIKGLGNYGDLTTSKEAAAAAVAKIVEIQKKLGISDVKLQDGIVGRGTLKASEGKEKNKEWTEAQNLITELNQSLYVPDFQKKAKQAKREGVLAGIIESYKGYTRTKYALDATVFKDAKSDQYKITIAEGQEQYTNTKTGEIFARKDDKLVSLTKQAEENKTTGKFETTNEAVAAAPAAAPADSPNVYDENKINKEVVNGSKDKTTQDKLIPFYKESPDKFITDKATNGFPIFSNAENLSAQDMTNKLKEAGLPIPVGTSYQKVDGKWYKFSGENVYNVGDNGEFQQDANPSRQIKAFAIRNKYTNPEQAQTKLADFYKNTPKAFFIDKATDGLPIFNEKSIGAVVPAKEFEDIGIKISGVSEYRKSQDGWYSWIPDKSRKASAYIKNPGKLERINV